MIPSDGYPAHQLAAGKYRQNSASLRGKRAIQSRATLSRTGSEQNPRLNLTSIVLIFEMSPFGSLSLLLIHSRFTFQLMKKQNPLKTMDIFLIA
jgi:hypothetical protein